MVMKKIKSDARKIERLLNNSGQNWNTLAQSLGMSRQLLSYHVTRQTVKLAEIVAPVLGLNPKDLLK
jgi:lambda repressor-like predicted transcriptional regulator